MCFRLAHVPPIQAWTMHATRGWILSCQEGGPFNFIIEALEKHMHRLPWTNSLSALAHFCWHAWKPRPMFMQLAVVFTVMSKLDYIKWWQTRSLISGDQCCQSQYQQTLSGR